MAIEKPVAQAFACRVSMHSSASASASFKTPFRKVETVSEAAAWQLKNQ